MRFGGWWFGSGWSHDWAHGWSGTLSEEDVTLLLLSLLLDEGPLHGYELALFLEERSGGGLEADVEMVYPLLQLLADREWVAVSTVDGKKRYELTGAGRERAEAREARIRRLWQLARHGSGGPDEEMIEEAVECACLSVDSVLEEVVGALGEVFGCGPASRARHRTTHGARRHGPGCRCC